MKISRIIYIIIFCAICMPSLQAQEDKKYDIKQIENIVDNPSFEDYRECPKKIEAHGILTIVEGWYQPTAGSADYYNRCGLKSCNVPRNKLGIQEPYNGDGYCGIYCSRTEYREYLQTELHRPLEKGCTYEVTFHVSLSEYSSKAIATIGALFTRERISDTSWQRLMHKETRKLKIGGTQIITTEYKPQIENPYDSVLEDFKGWQTVHGIFTAEGGEKFMTIGNYRTAEESNCTTPDSLQNYLNGAYYFIDDVEVKKIQCPEPPIEVPRDDKEIIAERYQTGTKIILKDIFFEFNKSTLLQQSYHQLQELLSLLNDNPTMQIELTGHTDNKGGKEYNRKLSFNRATAVAEYLIEKGIDRSRINAKGMGADEPIDTNETDEGRANNRRVEMRITKE